MRLLTIALLLFILSTGCSGGEPAKTNRQRKIATQARESASARQENKAAADTSKDREVKKGTLEQDVSYGSSDSLIVGEIASFAVDDQNRVFIADEDQTTIRVFNPDGRYLTSLGRQGHGPAEFAAVAHNTIIKIHSNRLYVPDYTRGSAYFPFRVQVFLLENLSFLHTIKTLAENKNHYSTLKKYYPQQIYPRRDGKLLVGYRRSPNEYRDAKSYIRYVIQDSTGYIVSGPVFQQRDRTNLVYVNGKGIYPIRILHSFPFFGKSLLAVSDNGRLYSANNTQKFKIDVYDANGKHIGSFQHPFNNKTFNKRAIIHRYEKKDYMPQLGEGVAVKMIRQAQNLPKTWPALESMFFDDQNRLWVSTIIDNDNLYKWWVLTKSGKVVAQFKWPRNKPIKAVRNGYLYTKETDKNGIETVVRYQIEMQ